MTRLIALLLLVATPLAAASPETEALALINQQRAAAGCAPLVVSKSLQAAAQSYAQAMAQQNFFGHFGKDGSTLLGRLRRAGFEGRHMGENLAAGMDDPQDLVRGWMASPGHRKHILNCRYTQTGIALAEDPQDQPLRGHRYAFTWYWVQEFGAP